MNYIDFSILDRSTLLTILFIATRIPVGVLHDNVQMWGEIGEIRGIVIDKVNLKHSDFMLLNSASWASNTTQGSSTWGTPMNR